MSGICGIHGIQNVQNKRNIIRATMWRFATFAKPLAVHLIILHQCHHHLIWLELSQNCGIHQPLCPQNPQHRHCTRVPPIIATKFVVHPYPTAVPCCLAFCFRTILPEILPRILCRNNPSITLHDGRRRKQTKGSHLPRNLNDPSTNCRPPPERTDGSRT